MGNCRTPGPTCTIRTSSNATRGPSGLYVVVGHGRQLVGQSIELVVQLGRDIQRDFGIPDLRGFVALREKINKSYGLSVALGKFRGKPCMYEYKVDLGRDGWGPFSSRVWTGGYDLKIPPTYLKGTKQRCYVPGNFIFLQELKKEQIERGFSVILEDIRPGALKFLSYILNDGKPKMYKFGYVILNIKPKGDGSGEVEMQPVVFYGGIPKPIGIASPFGVGGMYSKYTNTDLNRMFHKINAWNGDFANFVLGFVTLTAELTQAAVGGIQKKLAKEIIGRFAKDAFKVKISKKVAMSLAKASLAFSKAFVGEIVTQLDKQSVQVASNNSKIKEQILKKAVIKGIGAFLATVLSDISSESIKNLIPKKELEGLSDRLAIWFLKKHNAFLIKMTTGLFSLYADKLDPNTGKISKKLDEKAMDSYKGELQKSYKNLMEELVDALSEFAFG